MRPPTITRHRPPTRSIASAVAAVLLTACGNGGTTAATVGGQTATESPVVQIERSRFAPTEITVTTGATVEFVNRDPFDHTVTAATEGPTSFDSGSFGQGETFRHSFEEAGTYRYFCEIHPTMRASITVE